jgi:hypothetical protein
MWEAKIGTHRQFLLEAYEKAIGWKVLAAAMRNGERAVEMCAPPALRVRVECRQQHPPTLRRFNRGVRAHADT